MAHSKAHWGITKTTEAIADNFAWEKMREDVKKFVLHCATCLEKQGVNLKEGAYMPRVSNEQGEIVYLDLIGPVSEKISSFKYLLTMKDGFSRFVMVAPLRSKSAKEVSSVVLNTWVKGDGGIPKTFHADNGKEFTAHIAQQLYNKLGIHFSFGLAENHQRNPVERFHQTLYKLINSLRSEGEDNFIKGVKTAVMLYNGAKHLSTGVTPNILFLGREVVLPTDLLQGAPPLGPDNRTPNEIVDQMLRQAQQYQQVATQNQLRAIRRNTAHYLNIARTFEPGDLVFAFSESRGDQVPHRKLRIKWSGPYVFIRRINSQTAEIGTLPSEKGQYLVKNFVIHCTKLRLHQRQGDR